MPTPEVTGTAASLCEEIKSIAHEYAKEILGKQPMKAQAIPEIWENAVADTEKALAELFEPLIAYLSKDYCIVPKEQIYMRHGVALALMEQDPARREFYRGQSSVLESIFGTALFNEEKE